MIPISVDRDIFGARENADILGTTQFNYLLKNTPEMARGSRAPKSSPEKSAIAAFCHTIYV